MKNSETGSKKSKAREIARSEEHVNASLAQFENAIEHLEEKILESVQKVEHVRDNVKHATEKVQHAIDTARHPERIVHEGVERTRQTLAPYIERGRETSQKMITEVRRNPRPYAFGAALLVGSAALYLYLTSRRATPWQKLVRQLPRPRF